MTPYSTTESRVLFKTELSFSLVRSAVSVLRSGRLPGKFPDIAMNFLAASTGQKNIPVKECQEIFHRESELPLAGKTSTVTEPAALYSLGFRIVSFR